MVLRNPYGVEMGTTALIIQAASREEILAELQRFLPVNQVRGRIDQPVYWDYLVRMLREQAVPLLSRAP